MTVGVSVVADALAGLDRYLDAAPKAARRAMRFAINDTLSGEGLRAARAEIARQAAFPAGYLTDPRRLSVSRRATDDFLEGAILGRQRPTSLARFSIGGAAVGRQGVAVRVKPGNSRVLNRAFTIRLRQGAVLDEDTFNLGLAVRLRPGERIEGKRLMARGAGGGSVSGLYLLYGPSVDQIFRDVAAAISPEIAAKASIAFLEKFDRFSREV